MVISKYADPWIKADWPAPPGVHALVTLRHGAGSSRPPYDHFNLGMRCGDDPAAVQANRAELITRCALPGAPHWLRQVHGVGVVRFDTGQVEVGAAAMPAGHRRVVADDAMFTATSRSRSTAQLPEARQFETQRESDRAPEPEADAAVTSTPGVVLAILTADCLPVVFAARDGAEVAAAHAGWRGLADGVLEATVRAMDTPAADLLAWLGPAAGPQAYEVGQEVYEAFVIHDVQARAAFTQTRPRRHWRVDLYALARQRLAAVGVVRVYGGGQCTLSDPQRYYSYRRDQRSGRMATLIWRAAL